MKRVMIVSGESSGELYGAFLAKSLFNVFSDIEIIGVGGERMQSVGVRLISKISSAFGIIEALKTYKDIKKTFHTVISSLKSFHPQCVVLIDYPDFNLKVAKEAKRLGIKILYYVSPQIWAWRKNRIRTIKKLVDKIAVIFPFEEDIYKKASIPCEFVGHPVMDEINEVLEGLGFTTKDIGSLELKLKVKEELGLDKDKTVIAIMPGSRQYEIENLLPTMIDTIKDLKQSEPNFQFVITQAPNLINNNFFYLFTETEKVFKNQAIKVLLASDMALVASGTATLQSALLFVPMVVVYKLSPLTFFIGKIVVDIKHISIANILLDKSVLDASKLRFQELLQREVNKENLISEIKKIMDNSEYRSEIISQMEKIRVLFTSKTASLKTAEIIGELINQKGTNR